MFGVLNEPFFVCFKTSCVMMWRSPVSYVRSPHFRQDFNFQSLSKFRPDHVRPDPIRPDTVALTTCPVYTTTYTGHRFVLSRFVLSRLPLCPVYASTQTGPSCLHTPINRTQRMVGGQAVVSCLGYHENVFMSSVLRRKMFSRPV